MPTCQFDNREGVTFFDLSGYTAMSEKLDPNIRGSAPLERDYQLYRLVLLHELLHAVVLHSTFDTGAKQFVESVVDTIAKGLCAAPQ